MQPPSFFKAPACLPRQLRSNLSLLLLFAQKNDDIRKDISNEFSSAVPREKFLAMWDYATKSMHDFYMLDFDAPPKLRFRKNFDEVFVVAQP